MKKSPKNAQFYAPVRKVDSSELNPKLEFMSYNECKVLVTNVETGAEVEVNNCSHNYGLIPNERLFPAIVS